MRHVVIMGPMGVGKSTAGRAVSAWLGWTYSDSDDEIERVHGATGRTIAERDGVAALHRIEARILLDALAEERPIVITAAASTIESDDVRRQLSERSIVVVLEAPTEQVLRQQAADSHRRPMSVEEHERLTSRRAGWFDEVADLRVSAAQTPPDVVEAIMAHLDSVTPVRFSANLGFLWTDLPLPDAIRAAGRAGFDAVECHAPFDHAPSDVAAALSEHDLPMVSLNTRTGTRDGDYGLAAMPGREPEARALIDEAISYAAAIDCRNVHVLAGRSGRTADAETTYRSNLAYAADAAAAAGRRIVIEPLNDSIAEYHLHHIDAAVSTVEAVGADNLRIMVDCFHSRRMDGDLHSVFDQAWPYLGHVQISAHPDRGEPDAGDIDYSQLLPELVARGWDGPFGAEYTPREHIDDGLAWLEPWKQRRRTS